MVICAEEELPFLSIMLEHEHARDTEIAIS